VAATVSAIRDDVAGIAVYPGQPGSVHLTRLPRPTPGPGQALVRVRRVGVCGTDREIIDAKFGTPPPGANELVLGHEVLGVVEAVGEGVTGFKPGDLVSATVRRPDGCPACQAGQPDMCLWRGYTERGIIGLHGFMAEQFVDDVRYLIPIPQELEPVGVLIEPLSVVEKAVRQAELIQRRIVSWAPQTAIVLGAGPIGILATLLLRAKGAEVYTLARTPAPNTSAALLAACGATYVSTRETPFRELLGQTPNADLILEATGNVQLGFEAMDLLGNNGVLVWLAVVGTQGEAPVPVDSIMRGHVLGNKVTVGSVNSAFEDFSNGVGRLRRFEELWPGLTHRLITARLRPDDASRIAEAVGDGVKTVVEFGG
jgi:threonine dehydrogenase-like Zn-dependent dehydrogenase